MKSMLQQYRRFCAAQSGLAMVEFALVAPLLILLLFGVVDVTRYILIAQKTEKMAHTAANVAAQSATLTRATLAQVMNATTDIMRPFATGENSRIFISSLYRDAGVNTTPRVNWREPGGGTLAVESRLGAEGAIPTLPVPFSFAERENLIAAEIYYRFTPLLANPWFGTTTLYRTAFYAPRFGALTTPPQ